MACFRYAVSLRPGFYTTFLKSLSKRIVGSRSVITRYSVSTIAFFPRDYDTTTEPLEDEMEKKQRVLFLSVHNSVRGQMAEGLLRSIAGDRFIATSGGVESEGEIDPTAAEVMIECGIDITTEKPKNVRD